MANGRHFATWRPGGVLQNFAYRSGASHWNGECNTRASVRRPRDWNKGAPPRQVLVLSSDEVVIDAAVAACVKAARFRRRCTVALRPFGLSFPLWCVLAVTDRLIRESNDAVSQVDVGRRAELDKNTVSYSMRRLEELGLVDRGPDEWCFAWRVILTCTGERLLQAACPLLAQVVRAEVAPMEVAPMEVAPMEVAPIEV